MGLLTLTLRHIGFQESPTKTRLAVAEETTWQVMVEPLVKEHLVFPYALTHTFTRVH
jgi:hypothetical protein